MSDFSDNDNEWDTDENEIEEINEIDYIYPEDCIINNINQTSIEIIYDCKNILNETQQKYFNKHKINICYKKISNNIKINGGKLGLILDFKFKKYKLENDDYLVIKIVNKIKNILKNLNLNCLICDKKLDYYNYKPSICNDILCEHGYNELNICSSIREEILRDRIVCDLLISLFYSACFSKFEIYKLRMNKDIVIKTFRRCPNVNDLYNIAINTKNEYEFKNKINSINENLYELLKYIIDSCPLYIETEKNNKFRIITSSEKNFRFNKLLQEVDGQINIAYHGSSLINWHNIIRMGLKNYSGTKHQANGAAYGNGIYLGKEKTLPLSYCIDGFYIWDKSNIFNLKKEIKIIAECEVIDKKNTLWSKFNQIYVVQLEDYVNIKYIHIYN